MLKALIFDMDGTITELSLPLEAMRQDTKDYYVARGLPPNLLEPADGISSSTTKAKEFFLKNGLELDRWNQMEEEVDKILSAHEGFAAETARLLDGTLDVVKKLRQNGYMTAILTNNGRSSVEKIMEQIPLRDFFDVIQTRHESPRPKPYPDGLLKIVSNLGLNKTEVIYIGDALIDATAADRAGIEFWGVATGETPREVLINAGASKVFCSLDEILDEILYRK